MSKVMPDQSSKVWPKFGKPGRFLEVRSAQAGVLANFLGIPEMPTGNLVQHLEMKKCRFCGNCFKESLKILSYFCGLFYLELIFHFSKSPTNA